MPKVPLNAESSIIVSISCQHGIIKILFTLFAIVAIPQKSTKPYQFTMKLFSLLAVSVALPSLCLAYQPGQSGGNPGNRRTFLTTAVTTTSILLQSMAPARASASRIQFGDESIMRPKSHGTSEAPVQEKLLYSVDNKLADRICNFNRHFAERAGYFTTTDWEDQVRAANGPITYYDSVTGKPLFVAPKNRSVDTFLAESRLHGWPSFRDDEVVWDNVRVLKNSGETVSIDGTHLGHNLPDSKVRKQDQEADTIFSRKTLSHPSFSPQGNRYCINLVSIAGQESKM